jgi:hypothetical protein
VGDEPDAAVRLSRKSVEAATADRLNLLPAAERRLLKAVSRSGGEERKFSTHAASKAGGSQRADGPRMGGQAVIRHHR